MLVCDLRSRGAAHKLRLTTAVCLQAGQPEQPLQAVPQILVAVPVAEQKDEKVKHQSKKKHSKQW